MCSWTLGKEKIRLHLFTSGGIRRSGVIAYLVYRLATGWTVRGSNPSGREIFGTRPDRRWGPPSVLYSRYRVTFPGVKWPRLALTTPPSSVEVKERLELYLYSHSGPSCSVLGGWGNLLFTRWRWLVNFMPRPLYLLGKRLQYWFNRSLVGLHVSFGCFGKAINVFLLPRNERRFLKSSSR
jgi:hypothetical protein